MLLGVTFHLVLPEGTKQRLLFEYLFPTFDGWASPPTSYENLFHNGSSSFSPLWLNERRRLQGRWSKQDKAWLVPLSWAPAPNHGGPTSLGVYAVEPITKGTLIRKSAIVDHYASTSAETASLGKGGVGTAPGSFLRLRSYEDLERFCQLHSTEASTDDKAALMRYVSDYLFRAKPPHGSPGAKNDTQYALTAPHTEQVFGIWMPGCADNDANPDETANVEDRLTPAERVVVKTSDGGQEEHMVTYMGFYAMRNIAAGEILLSDYDGAYNTPPAWAAAFANDHLGGWLAFKGHNHKYMSSKKTISGDTVSQKGETSVTA